MGAIFQHQQSCRSKQDFRNEETISKKEGPIEEEINKAKEKVVLAMEKHAGLQPGNNTLKLFPPTSKFPEFPLLPRAQLVM